MSNLKIKLSFTTGKSKIKEVKEAKMPAAKTPLTPQSKNFNAQILPATFTIIETLIHEIEAETEDEAIDMMSDSTVCDGYIDEIIEDEI